MEWRNFMAGVKYSIINGGPGLGGNAAANYAQYDELQKQSIQNQMEEFISSNKFYITYAIESNSNSDENLASVDESSAYFNLDIPSGSYGMMYDGGKKKAQSDAVPDLTSQFNQRVSEIQAVFGGIGVMYNKKCGGPILSYPAKFAAFGYIQYKGAGTKFMNPKVFSKSVFTVNNGGYVNGEYFTPDDFGNYFYGAAANAMGISLLDAIQGAGAYAVYRKISGHNSVITWWNLPGFFDEFKDTKTIIRGYHGN